MKLSIITINWNNREGLRKTIESVLNQTAREQFEYVVVDGASTDGGKEMLENEYADRIDKWISEPDKGIYNAMNKGVRMASGEYCVVLNSGDIYHEKDTIETVLPHLHGEDMVIGRMRFMATGLLMEAPEPITLLGLYERSIPHNAAFVKRDLLLQYPYDENYLIVSDWKFFVQALILHNASYRLMDITVTDFDCSGVSARNRDACGEERHAILTDLFPSRVLQDYFQFTHGEGYTGSDYDRFYVKLKDYKYGHVLYGMNVCILRIVSLLKKGARFARSFPLRLKSLS